jgi:hypothetical protein
LAQIPDFQKEIYLIALRFKPGMFLISLSCKAIVIKIASYSSLLHRMYCLALIELHQETNSFSLVPTQLRNFEAAALYYDEEVHTEGDKHRLQIDGFRKAIRRFGKGRVELVPILSAWSNSGGKITAEVYDHFKAHVLDRLKASSALPTI